MIKLSFVYRRKLQRGEKPLSHYEKRLIHYHAYGQTFLLLQAEAAAGWEAIEPLWEKVHAVCWEGGLCHRLQDDRDVQVIIPWKDTEQFEEQLAAFKQKRVCHPLPPIKR